MKERNYTVEELLNDDSFISHISNPDSKDNEGWDLRLISEDNLKVKKEAIEIIKALKYQDLNFTKKDRHNIWDKIDQQTRPIHRPAARRSLKAWMKVAAVLIPVFMSTALFFYYESQNNSLAEIAESLITKECQNGQKMLVTLPDGSTVKLNSGSQISYSSNFEKDMRVVWLEGEGFFDVKKNIEKPFVIISGTIRTQVLGTSFNVKSYPEESVVDVVVASGLVSVSRYDKTEPNKLRWDNISGVVLNPSEKVSYDLNNGQFSEISTVNTDEFLAWKAGILIFNNAEFDEIFSRLERWYGIEFELEDEVEIPDGFTGRFDNQPLRRVLEGIGYTSKFAFEIEDKKVTIKEMNE